MPSDDEGLLIPSTSRPSGSQTGSPPPRFPRTCFMCITVISSQEAFDKHMEEHKNMPLLNCNVCKKGFLHEKLLVLHKQVLHPNLCDICNVELESTRMQIDHMLEVHRDIVDHIPFEEWCAGRLDFVTVSRSWLLFDIFGNFSFYILTNGNIIIFINFFNF
jgi:hypothetical protein